MKRFVLVAAAVAALGTVPLFAQPSGPPTPEQIIAIRQADMDLQAGIMAALKSAVDGNLDVKPLAQAGKGLAASAAVIPVRFPQGTQQGHGTKAKPNIWTDWTGFQQAAANLQTQAQRLTQLADANDKAGFANQFKAVGEACGACHRQFRERS